MPTAEMFFMLTRIRNFALFTCAFLVAGQWEFESFGRVYAQAPQARQRFSVNGAVENNDGKLRLVLTNNSPGEFHGVARIGLGNSDEQKEIGDVSITLPSNEVSLFQITGVAPSGDHYTLAIYDQFGGRLFFRIAPLRQISDPTSATVVAITPIQSPKSRASTSSSSAEASALPAKPYSTDKFAIIATQVQVKTRLLASQDGGDSFTLFFELRAQKPVNTAILAISADKLKDQKQISINLQSNVEFRLPDSLQTDKVNYILNDKDGRVLAKGELNLQKLMDDDFVSASDIRTDRTSYQSGEMVRMTVMLEGKSQSGYRVEVSVRDGQSQVFFRDQKIIGKDESFNSLDFSFTLPNNVSAPVAFEFRIFDAETGLLFDSGEREVPIAPAKP